MATLQPVRSRPGEPAALHAHAMDNLRFIRETMEGATSFTAVSGWGMVAVGLTALAAAAVAWGRTGSDAWLGIWLGEALLSLLIAGGSAWRKARSCRLPLFAMPGRKFALSFSPPMVVGALLTAAFYHYHMAELLPGVWLLLFGTGIVTGGAFSVRVVPVMGLCFMAVGAATLFCPAAWADGCMAAGFGGLNLVFGVLIARRHGG